MRRSTNARWAIGTLAIVAIALSVDSIRRTESDFDSVRGPQLAIRSQLTALQRGMFATAYRFAAPEIREQFPLSDFRRMVEDGYPELASWSRLTFGPPQRRGDTIGVPVAVAGKTSAWAHFVYWMRHDAGGWRVAGVERDHAGSGPGMRRRRSRPPELQETTSLDRRSAVG